MASGFVQRWKGKVKAAQLWADTFYLGQTQVSASGVDINTLKGWGAPVSVANSSITGSSGQLPISPAAGVINLNASTVLGIFTLGRPVPGAVAILNVSTCGSSGYFIKVSTVSTGAADVTIQGVLYAGASGQSTIASCLKSTLASQIELVGLTTNAWLFNGVTPSTLGHLVWSTST